MKITLIGLGIFAGDLTVRARAALDKTRKIIAQTRECRGFESLDGYGAETLDGIYKSSRNFDTLNKKLADFVIKAAKESDVCYCVDGSVSENESCKIILKRHRDIEIIDGVSKSAYFYSLAHLSCAQPVCLSAYGTDGLKSCRAAVVYDIDCDYIAGVVKAKLADIFGDEGDCVFMDGDRAKRIKIYEIDRMGGYGSACAVAVEEREYLKKERYDFDDLEEMIRLLRKPNGCPWDRAQTPESIKGNIIEEAYELVDAIERDDIDGIEEETGDVLLQAAFSTVLQEERGSFTSGDAITRLVKKLIFRHSHIFGADRARDDGEALSVWEKNKVKEKGQTTFTDSVRAVPINFPACMRAQKVQKRAAKSGMDFSSSISAAERLTEELGEMIDEQVKENKDGVYDEAGDVLFSAVNACRLAGVDCEQALRAATDKFVKRFARCEELVLADGKQMTDLDELQLDMYWKRAKLALE